MTSRSDFASLELTRMWRCGKTYDIVLVAQLSPITSVIPAIFFAKIIKAKLVYWVFDLWPDSVISKRRFTRLLYNISRSLCGNIYRQANLLCITSEGFSGPLIEMGVKKGRIFYLPQWAQGPEKRYLDCEVADTQIFAECGKKINVVFTGNIGSAQNLTEVIEAIKISEVKSKYNFVFVGNGRMLDQLKKMCVKYQLEETVKFTGRLPSESLNALYERADFLLLPLKSSPVFDLTLPAKLQTYMVAGKPIMVMADGEAKSIVERAQCGYTCSKNDRFGYAALLQECATVSPLDMETRGHNSRRYASIYFEKEKIINKFLQKIRYEI